MVIHTGISEYSKTSAHNHTWSQRISISASLMFRAATARFCATSVPRFWRSYKNLADDLLKSSCMLLLLSMHSLCTSEAGRMLRSSSCKRQWKLVIAGTNGTHRKMSLEKTCINEGLQQYRTNEISPFVFPHMIKFITSSWCVLSVFPFSLFYRDKCPLEWRANKE